MATETVEQFADAYKAGKKSGAPELKARDIATASPPKDLEQPEKTTVARDGQRLTAFEEDVASLFPLDSLINGDGDATPTSLSLDAATLAYSFGPQIAESSIPNRLNCLHLEPLLDQAADILDRAMTTRQAFDETAAKMFSLLLELNECVELDRIHTREEQAGLYDVPYARARAEWHAEWLTEVLPAMFSPTPLPRPNLRCLDCI